MSKADKMRGRLASIQKDREEFERQKKELEADMHIGRNNMRNINRGLRNNAILEEPIVVEAGSVHVHHSSKPNGSHVSGRIASNVDNHTNGINLSVSTNSSVTPKDGLIPSSTSSSSAHANGHFFGGAGAGAGAGANASGITNGNGTNSPGLMSIMPSGPRISDWCYTAPLDSPAPPTVKSREIYENVRLLGRGSFGEVNLVKNTEDNKLFAIKTQLCPKDNEFHNVLREVRFLRACRHPCIIDVHDAFLMTNPRIVFIVMHYCEAGTISSVISSARKNKSNLAENQVIKWVLQLALAMQFLHDNFVVHRDLKPMNVMLTEGGDTLKLADFGLAMSMADKADSENTDEAGTPYYTAPEMIQREPYSYPADCWSFGVIVHQLLALERPFEGSSTAELVKSILSGEIPPLPAHYSDDIKLISRELLRKDQTERLTMTELLLEPILHSKLVAFPNAYRPRTLEERIRRSHQKQLEVQIEALSRARKTDGGPRNLHEKIQLRQQAAEAKAAEEAAIAAAAAVVTATSSSTTNSVGNGGSVSVPADGSSPGPRHPSVSMSRAGSSKFHSIDTPSGVGATNTSTRNSTPSGRLVAQPPSTPLPRHSVDLTSPSPRTVDGAPADGEVGTAEPMTSRSEAEKFSAKSPKTTSRQSSGRLIVDPAVVYTVDAVSAAVSNSMEVQRANSKSLMTLAEEESSKSVMFSSPLLGSASVKAQRSNSMIAAETAENIEIGSGVHGSERVAMVSETPVSAAVPAVSVLGITAPSALEAQDLSEITQTGDSVEAEDHSEGKIEVRASGKGVDAETPQGKSEARSEEHNSEGQRVIIEASDEASVSAVDLSGISTIASSPIKSDRMNRSESNSTSSNANPSLPTTPLGGRKGQELARVKRNDSFYEAQLSEHPLSIETSTKSPTKDDSENFEAPASREEPCTPVV